jgi:hypothetical protein
MEPRYNREIDRRNGHMYYDDYGYNYNRYYMDYNANGNSGSNGGMSSGSRGYSEKEYMIPMRDYREGRSPASRRMYMEAKEMKMDKAASMKELEKYVQELTHDMVEMVADASPEEKQYLEKRIAALANKVGQMNA